MKIRLAGIREASVADGPGIRTVVFLQGCLKQCKGCHNPDTWSLDGGFLEEVDDLVLRIGSICTNKKVTISGGEPLLQYEQLKVLLQKLKENGYDICLYTGYEIEQVPKEILRYLNYIKVGGYEENLRDLRLPYVGSKNQKFYAVECGGDRICLKEI